MSESSLSSRAFWMVPKSIIDDREVSSLSTAAKKPVASSHRGPNILRSPRPERTESQSSRSKSLSRPSLGGRLWSWSVEDEPRMDRGSVDCQFVRRA
jgi:hypothetical protein